MKRLKNPIIVALDVSDIRTALHLAMLLDKIVGGFKINIVFSTVVLVELVTARTEEEALTTLQELHALFKLFKGRLFMDGKFHDTPTSIRKAIQMLPRLGVYMFDVHAAAGKDALREANEYKGDALAVGVTLLSSLSEADVMEHFAAPIDTKAYDLARNVKEAGFDGVVCSSRQLKNFKQFGSEVSGLIKVAVGIRPKDWPADDHEETMTAAEAIETGADYLVIGRPITDALDPVKAARQFVAEAARASR